MSEFEKAAIIVMVMLASITVVCLVAVLIASKNIDKLETENSITKSKYFELDRKIFYLEKRIKKLEPKDEAEPKTVKIPITDYGLKDYIPPNNQTPSNDPIMSKWTTINDSITDEKIRQTLTVKMDYTTWMTIKECIELLSTDGKGTKQQVKEKLEELIKDE